MRRILERGAFFESPRWHDGRWWFSDFFRRVVVAVDARGGVEEVMHVEGRPSGLGWMPDGSLLVVSMVDRLVLRRMPSGEVTVHAELAELCDWHANDMVVDRAGGAYVGNFGFELGTAKPSPTSLVRVDRDGSAERVADGLLFPNGSVITPDGRTLIVAETWAARISAFTIGDDGSLPERRVWAVVPHTAPDGLTLDAEGCVWLADARSARCLRVAQGGRILDEVAVPEGLRCFACMLGGEDGRTLAVCAAPDYDERARAASPEAIVFAQRVEVPHAGLP